MKNYTPISLLSVAKHLPEFYSEDWKRTWIINNKENKHGSGTIYLLWFITNSSTVTGKKWITTSMLNLDWLSKCVWFSKSSISLLALDSQGVSKPYIRLLKVMYENSTVQILRDRHLVKIKLEKGVQQGDSLFLKHSLQF